MIDASELHMRFIQVFSKLIMDCTGSWVVPQLRQFCSSYTEMVYLNSLSKQSNIFLMTLDAY